jgi:hypothetical protein
MLITSEKEISRLTINLSNPFFGFGFNTPHIIDRTLDLCKNACGCNDQYNTANDRSPYSLVLEFNIGNNALYLHRRIMANKTAYLGVYMPAYRFNTKYGTNKADNDHKKRCNGKYGGIG